MYQNGTSQALPQAGCTAKYLTGSEPKNPARKRPKANNPRRIFSESGIRQSQARHKSDGGSFVGSFAADSPTKVVSRCVGVCLAVQPVQLILGIILRKPKLSSGAKLSSLHQHPTGCSAISVLEVYATNSALCTTFLCQNTLGQMYCTQ